MFGWDATPERVVVETMLVGGGFGGKEDVSVQHLAALAAMAGATSYCIFSGAEVATVRSLIMTPDVGWSYNPGAAWQPDTSRYTGNLGDLAKRELP